MAIAIIPQSRNFFLLKTGLHFITLPTIKKSNRSNSVTSRYQLNFISYEDATSAAVLIVAISEAMIGVPLNSYIKWFAILNITHIKAQMSVPSRILFVRTIHISSNIKIKPILKSKRLLFSPEKLFPIANVAASIFRKMKHGDKSTYRIFMIRPVFSFTSSFTKISTVPIAHRPARTSIFIPFPKVCELYMILL